MRRKILSILVSGFFIGLTQSASAQIYEQLIAGAKKEGRLVVYASATAPQLQMYFAAFNKKYPFIKTEFFRTGKQALLSKVLLEEQAKQRIADVIHTSVIETNIMKKPPLTRRSTRIQTGFGRRPMRAALCSDLIRAKLTGPRRPRTTKTY
jgi:hypothetical protein